MKNRNLVYSLALSVSLMLPAIANSVNRSTIGPALHGQQLQADGIPLPPPPKPKPPSGVLTADGIPLPPPPKPKPIGKFVLPSIGQFA